MSADPNLWDNQEKAQKLMSEKNTLEASLDAYDGYVKSLDDYAEMVEFAESENDEAMLGELQHNLEELQSAVKHAELEALLSGEADANDTYLEVHAGSGGTDAMDWAQMLLRMYTRWAENHHYKVEYIEETEGDVAGLKSATIKISGHNAYGWLKSESGVHRLVRISPFDSAARRHTSFASVGVYPVVDDNIQIEINESALPAPADSILTKRIRRCVLPIFRPALSFPAKLSVRNFKTAITVGKCCGRAYMKEKCKNVPTKRRKCVTIKATMAGATRFAPMFCSRTA